ncbi:leucine efflux protein LeuE [Polynucleobacter sp. UK-Mo-2m-Kol15]|uniref:leucine efflux protein LeuE n=1 Tax=Polynucleobacter sp. UK-Mo-2m-Kol15 TaxID=2576916 RepID=UPI001C0D6146|nr:leucine efflux protein LeuE [Polynucleobacter sp. UK-Mo-2m-Kol15]MBU3576111.1 leucine efflux protein LeuE [Polynucleobacter sp. UK-Mo-2m-Kol15]
MDWFISPASVGIVDFPTYFVGVIFVILFPGPNSLYVLTIAGLKGWRAGVLASLGIFIGDAILMMAVALGAASLLQSSPSIFNLIRILGAAYLAWMGYGFIRGGLVRWRGAQLFVAEDGSAHYLNTLHPFLVALTLSLTNPKAIFFFVSFFAQFIQPGYAKPGHTILYLALVLQAISMSYLAGLIFTGQFFLSFFKTHPHYAAALWLIVGVLLIAFAGKLLL